MISDGKYIIPAAILLQFMTSLSYPIALSSGNWYASTDSVGAGDTLESPVFPGHDPLVQMMIDQVSESNIYDYIDTLQNFENENGVPTRRTGTVGFQDSALWAYHEFRSFGLYTFMQNFTSRGHSSTNVIAVHPGTNPDLEPQTFIIGGHLDSISNTETAPGADDNASGSTVTMEAARIMSQYSFARTIRFALWGAEEQGLHGSAYYVSNIDVETEKVMGKLNYDMVGYADSSLAINLHANTPSNWMLDYKADVSDAYHNIGINFTYIYNSNAWRSDHSSFWNGGYNATWAIETAFSPYYHTAQDTLDKLTLPQITHMTRHAIATLAHLAGPVTMGDPPEITVTSPTGGEVWNANHEEYITWTTEEGDDPIDRIDLWYSTDNGTSWTTISTGMVDTGSYLWTIPNADSFECMIWARVIDSVGRWSDDISGLFTIIGTPPGAPVNLMVEHVSGEYMAVFDDFADGTYDGWTVYDGTWDASQGYLQGYGSISTPSIMEDEPVDAYGRWEFDIQFTATGAGSHMRLHFIHIDNPDVRSGSGYYVFIRGDNMIRIWRWDNGATPTNPVVYGSWSPSTGIRLLAVERDPDGTFRLYVDDVLIGSGTDNLYTTNEYIGFRHTQAHRVHEIQVAVMGEDDDHNLLTWEASPDDPTEVCHYSIYRSELQGGPWDASTLIDSVSADGSTQYAYTDPLKGMADEIYWWYVIRAVGKNGLEEQNTDTVQEPGELVESFDITLYAGGAAGGWNFVSFNLIPTDSSLEAIISDIDGNYDRVMYYDATTDEWLTHVPGRAARYNNLHSWTHRMGIWIHMTTTDTLIIYGNAPASTDLTLYPGWTMVSLPSSSSGNHGLPGEVSIVGYFDATADYNLGYRYYPGSIPPFVFEPGRGYWVYNSADEAVVWTVEY